MASSSIRAATAFRPCKLILFTDSLLIAEPISSLFDSNPNSKLRPIEVISLKNATVLDMNAQDTERMLFVMQGVY